MCGDEIRAIRRQKQFPFSCNKKNKETKSLSIRFPVHILEQMKELAKRHHRSLSGEVLTALEEHIKRNQKGK